LDELRVDFNFTKWPCVVSSNAEEVRFCFHRGMAYVHMGTAIPPTKLVRAACVTTQGVLVRDEMRLQPNISKRFNRFLLGRRFYPSHHGPTVKFNGLSLLLRRVW
jgi:hypothetical protein